MKIAVIVIGSLAVLILTVLVIGALLPKHHIATRSATFTGRSSFVFFVPDRADQTRAFRVQYRRENRADPKAMGSPGGVE